MKLYLSFFLLKFLCDFNKIQLEMLIDQTKPKKKKTKIDLENQK